MKLTIFEYVLGNDAPIADDSERAVVGDEDRASALAVMRQKLVESTAGLDPITFSINATTGELLDVEIKKFGQAASAVWSFEGEPVAASVQLLGKNGTDDMAAVDSVRNHQPSFPFPPAAYNKAIARQRPCLAILFTNAEWLRNTQIEVLVSALLFALLSRPDSSPSMHFQKPMTEAEKAETTRKGMQVAEVYQIIYNDWVARRKLLYTVRPSEKIKGRPISEIMHVTFWVGVQGRGQFLNIDQTVAVFEMLKDQMEQLPGLKNLKEMRAHATVNLKHEPAVLAALLAQITMTEPQ